MNVIEKLEKKEAERLLESGKTIPDFSAGDTLIVQVRITEGSRTRLQAFEGVCIARSGAGLNESFTVRKISYGEGVERVFYMSNFITVTKTESIDWIELQDPIRAVIRPYLEEEEKPLILQELDKDPLFDENDTEVVKQIKGILDEYIRPAVEQDGGAITFASFQEGVVKVNLQGSCSGCPASTVTLKSGIENLLKRMLPNDVKEVVAEGVQSLSTGLF